MISLENEFLKGNNYYYCCFYSSIRIIVSVIKKNKY